MTDFFDIVSIVFTFSLALSFGFFCKWLLLLIKKRALTADIFVHTRRHCMEASCIFLSICIACIAVILIWTQWQSILAVYTLKDYMYYFVVFFATYICIVFFRVLAPVFLGLYVLYCVIFAFLLFHSYSTLPKDFTVEASQGESVAFHSVILSYKNLFPLPRYWVSAPIVSTQIENASNTSILFAQSIEQFGENSFGSKAIVLLSSLIIEKDTGFQTNYVEISAENSLLQTVNYSVYGKNASIQVESF